MCVSVPITWLQQPRRGRQEAAMFFVFGPSGQMYRGGPENLAHISPVRRVARPQALRTRAADVESFVMEPPEPSAPGPAPASVSLRGHDAVTAYTQTGQGPTQARQPLTRVRDVMTTNTLSVRPDAVVNHAWQTLAEHGVAQAPRGPPTPPCAAWPRCCWIPVCPACR